MNRKMRRELKKDKNLIKELYPSLTVFNLKQV